MLSMVQQQLRQQLSSQELPARAKEQRQQKHKTTACRPVLQAQWQCQRQVTIMHMLLQSYQQQQH
jgi:hypothetical protein